MKKTLAIISICLICTIVSYGQIFQSNENFEIIRLTNNRSIGFGKSSNTNQYLHIIVNGPLVNENGRPVGGYVDNYAQRKEWVNPSTKNGNFAADNCIFGLDVEGKMRLIPYKNFSHTTNFIWAFQNGRRLLHNGVNKHNASSPNKYIRSGIGFDQNNNIYIIVSKTPVTYWQLAQEFKKTGCKEALYLDGNEAYVGIAYNGYKKGFNTNAIKIQCFHQKKK